MVFVNPDIYCQDFKAGKNSYSLDEATIAADLSRIFE